MKESTLAATAIILARHPFRESDTRVSAFSMELGYVDLVARGTRKPGSKLSAHLEPLTLSDLMIVKGRQYDYVGAAFNQNAFLEIKSDYDKISIAGDAIRIFRKMAKAGESDPALFTLLHKLFYLLENHKAVPAAYELWKNIFIIQLLALSGYCPSLYKCAQCQARLEPVLLYYDLKQGGVICESCRRKGRPDQAGYVQMVSLDCVKIMRLALEMDLKECYKLKFTLKLAKEFHSIVASLLDWI